jgi:hypothetical protein
LRLPEKLSIQVIGITFQAANGAAAEDPAAIILQYRGLAFQIGGDKNLSTHVTIPSQWFIS